MGYHQAGWDVVGVDIEEQPYYPFDFMQGDALTFNFDHWRGDFDAIHASPPCQDYAKVSDWGKKRRKTGLYPALIDPIRAALKATGLPYVIENVPGAPLVNPVMLCGTWFGLKVIRHRYFETNWPLQPMWTAKCDHAGCLMFEHKQERAYGDAMGCEWMNRDGHREAIPPAYTRWIGEQLLGRLEAAA